MPKRNNKTKKSSIRSSSSSPSIKTPGPILFTSSSSLVKSPLSSISKTKPKTIKKKLVIASSSLSNSNSSNLMNDFQKEITAKFFEILLMIKLFHWKTHSYATHKATDELYTKFNGNMDTFIEVLLGKTGSRIDLMNIKSIPLVDLNDTNQLAQKIITFKDYLVELTNNPVLSSMSNTDLLNIRDEILGDMNQFLYLLTFN
jgi:DNA-binding ferritin-like protein